MGCGGIIQILFGNLGNYNLGNYNLGNYNL